MTAGQATISIEQGVTFHTLLTWKDDAAAPVDLTLCTARLLVAVAKGSTAAPILTLDENHGITLGGAAGTIAVDLSASETAAITQSGVFELDVVFFGGRAVRVLEGPFLVSLSIDR